MQTLKWKAEISHHQQAIKRRASLFLLQIGLTFSGIRYVRIFTVFVMIFFFLQKYTLASSTRAHAPRSNSRLDIGLSILQYEDDIILFMEK